MKQDIHMSAEELSVHIQLNEGLVTQLTFEGANAQDPILKTFTKYCIGYSLRESAEHSAIYTVAEALRGTPRNASQGIDSVTMLSPALAQAQALLRKANKEHQNKVMRKGFVGVTLAESARSWCYGLHCMLEFSSADLKRFGDGIGVWVSLVD